MIIDFNALYKTLVILQNIESDFITKCGEEDNYDDNYVLDVPYYSTENFEDFLNGYKFEFNYYHRLINLNIEMYSFGEMMYKCDFKLPMDIIGMDEDFLTEWYKCRINRIKDEELNKDKNELINLKKQVKLLEDKIKELEK